MFVNNEIAEARLIKTLNQVEENILGIQLEQRRCVRIAVVSCCIVVPDREVDSIENRRPDFRQNNILKFKCKGFDNRLIGFLLKQNNAVFTTVRCYRH